MSEVFPLIVEIQRCPFCGSRMDYGRYADGSGDYYARCGACFAGDRSTSFIDQYDTCIHEAGTWDVAWWAIADDEINDLQEPYQSTAKLILKERRLKETTG